MKVRVIYESRIPKLLSIFINISGITLFPFIIYRNKEEEVPEITQRHEMIHIAQQRETWVIGFYLLYVFYWLKNVVKYKNTQVAYYNIPFEIEAYKNMQYRDYLSSREKHAWVRYIDDELDLDIS